MSRIPAPKLKPNWAGQWDTFEDWVNTASRTIAKHMSPTNSVGYAQEAVCIDSKGRRCDIGKDFMRARDDDSFPVFYFWNCEPVIKAAPYHRAAAMTYRS